MGFNIGSENGTSFKVLTTSVILLTSLLVLSFVVYADSGVRMWVSNDNPNVNERFTLYFDFPSRGSYSLYQVAPRETTVLRNRSVSSGRHKLSVTEDVAGEHRIKVVFEDHHGRRSTDYTSYHASRGGDQDQNGSGEDLSLSHLKSREPSQAGDVARSLQNQVEIIRQGDENYYQLKDSFNSKAQSLNFSQEKQVDPAKQSVDSLQRSLNRKGVTFLGNHGGKDVSIIGAPDPAPDPDPDPGPGPGPGKCLVLGSYSPTFICFPAWTPWPLPLPWVLWILMFV